MGSMKSALRGTASTPIGFSSLTYIFGMNILIYLVLHEVEIPYSTLIQVWSVNLRYKHTFVDRRRDEMN